MTVPMRPAAYVRVAPGSSGRVMARKHRAIARYAREQGWPEPAIYADEGPNTADGGGPALAALSDAIGGGRYDALLITGPGMISAAPEYLMSFLFRCTRHGVAVEFLHPPAPRRGTVAPPAPAAEHWPPSPLPRSCKSVLARAGVEALTGLFPAWQIWSDQHDWHARRRDGAYEQGYRPGAPAFCVHAPDPVELAAQLRWQIAADEHAPSGCSASDGLHPWLAHL